MNWLVAIQPKYDGAPNPVTEVRVFVVEAETAPGVRALIEEHQKGQVIIRWMRPEW